MTCSTGRTASRFVTATISSWISTRVALNEPDVREMLVAPKVSFIVV